MQKKVLVTFLSVAAACLLVLSPAVAAADQATAQTVTAKPALEFRFDGIVYAGPAPEAAATGAQRLSRFSVKLYGAYNYLAAGDINAGSAGYLDLFELYAAGGYGTSTGGYKPMHGGYDFGADIIYQITPRIGVGVGAGYLKSSRSSAMSFTESTATVTAGAKPTVSAVPVRLGLFYDRPLSTKLSLIAGLGGTWYAGLKMDSHTRLEDSSSNWETIDITGSRSSLANLGFHGSLGLEYKLSQRIGFFAEAFGRYARLKNFDSVTVDVIRSEDSPYSSSGKLYIYRITLPEGTADMFEIPTVPPAETDPVREPKIDLSGFSLQLGVRIRL